MLVPSIVFREHYCKELLARTVKELGESNILVNNATFRASRGSIEEIRDGEWDHTLRTNIYAGFNLAVVR